jgi:methionyl-tRNA formyltransferase
VLLMPSVACLNLHASLLPRHRGASPIQAAIESGDTHTGITVMYMAEGLDTGDILLERTLPIRRRETAGTLHERLAQLAPECLAEAVALLETGKAPRIPQDNSLATYAPKLGREHGLLEWNSPAAVDRKVRALNPWPAAYTILPGSPPKKLKVFSTIQSRRPAGGATPCTVLETGARGILVAAGEGAVWLTEIQLEGKKRMRACDFLRGHPIPAGTMLGSGRLP